MRKTAERQKTVVDLELPAALLEMLDEPVAVPDDPGDESVDVDMSDAERQSVPPAAPSPPVVDDLEDRPTPLPPAPRAKSSPFAILPSTVRAATPLPLGGTPRSGGSLCIRPEHFHLPPRPGDAGRVPVTVADVGFFGPELNLTCRLASGRAIGQRIGAGPVRVVADSSEMDRVQAGDVLVTRATTPAWTLLFASAAAVVTEGGGLLSHCAIVAREYGIPAVVGAAGAAMLIPDGAQVTVDGFEGRVTVH